jgi:hypothetical protein
LFRLPRRRVLTYDKASLTSQVIHLRQSDAKNVTKRTMSFYFDEKPTQPLPIVFLHLIKQRRKKRTKTNHHGCQHVVCARETGSMTWTTQNSTNSSLLKGEGAWRRESKNLINIFKRIT